MKPKSFLCCIVLVALMLSASVGINAQEAFVEGDFTYQLKSQGVSVVSYSGTSDIIEMPSVVTHDGIDYTVVEVGNKLFFKDENVVSINFPATAVTIGDSVCHECPLLSRVVIGDATTMIGESSFYKCKKLRLIVFGESLQLIKNDSFRGIEIGMNSSLDCETSPTFVFKGPDYPIIETDPILISEGGGRRIHGLCPSEYLTTYQTSERWKPHYADPWVVVVMLDSYSQEEYNNASVTLTSESDTIPVNSFTYQDYLLATTLDASQSYSKRLDYSCQLPVVFNTSRKWNNGCWEHNNTSVTTTYGLTTEGEKLILTGHINNKGTIPVYLFTPQNVLKITCETLPDAENVEDVYRFIQDQNVKYKIFVRNNKLWAEVSELLKPVEQFCYDYCYKIPDYVTLSTTVGSRSFYLVSIADDVFANSPLVSIEIGNYIETIGERAFGGSSQLARVILGDGVKEIKKDAFCNCPNLSLVVMGESLTSIDEGNFLGNEPQEGFFWMNSTKRQTFVLKGEDYPEAANDFIEHLSGGNIDVYCLEDKMGSFENSNKWTGNFNLLSYTNNDLKNSSIQLQEIYQVNQYDVTTYQVVIFGVSDIENCGGDITNQEFTLKLPLAFGIDKSWNFGVLDETQENTYWLTNDFYKIDNKIYINGIIEHFKPNSNSGCKYAYMFSPKRIYRIPIQAWNRSQESAITTVDADKQVASVCYYNLAGIESGEPFDGVNIKVTRYTDGSADTQKIVNKSR